MRCAYDMTAAASEADRAKAEKGRIAMETAKAAETEWTMEGDELPFQKSLYLTAIGFTGNPHAAEDLVQETYMKAFRHYGQFSKGTNLRAWLFKILKNSFINHYRKRTLETVRTRRFEIDFETLPSEPLPPAAPFPADASDWEIDDEIREAMATLPEEYLWMVILKDLNHYSYREISRLAKVPVGTVMSRLYRGRKMLEKALMSFGRRKGYLGKRSVIKQRDKSLRAS